ncbi:putative leucine Rich repeat-containing domain protein [Trichinella spiralis]|uniref:putative leucine Rich repeat-containing domain protein n=1 Tax=Trichinella spiralis TaxID=6334 RepID=UPI0001EFBC10|nr:putative leucine Rich repeat-containing domain protein [Trichinella spiralis]
MGRFEDLSSSLVWWWIVIHLGVGVETFCPAGCHCPEESGSVDCSGVGLSSVPILLDPRIGSLNLANNRIGQLNVDELGFYLELEFLDLSNNRIFIINNGALGKLHKLRVLKLNNNLLTSLGPDTLSGLTMLKLLDLSANALARLATSVFSDLGQLEALNLSNNAIASASPGAFTGLTKLKQLQLGHNQLADLTDAVEVDSTFGFQFEHAATIEAPDFRPDRFHAPTARFVRQSNRPNRRPRLRRFAVVEASRFARQPSGQIAHDQFSQSNRTGFVVGRCKSVRRDRHQRVRRSRSTAPVGHFRLSQVTVGSVERFFGSFPIGDVDFGRECSTRPNPSGRLRNPLVASVVLVRQQFHQSTSTLVAMATVGRIGFGRQSVELRLRHRLDRRSAVVHQWTVHFERLLSAAG